MNLLLMTYGTMGDVQPFVFLALGLQRAGHKVRLAAPTNFEHYVKSFGLDYWSYYGNTKEMLESEVGKKWMSSGDTRQFMRYMTELENSIRHQAQRDLLAASEGVDAIVGHFLTVHNVSVLSELRGVPHMMVYPAPYYPGTSQFPNPLVTTRQLPLGMLNTLTHALFRRAFESGKRANIAEWRAELGLPAPRGTILETMRKLRTPTLHIYSSHLVPRPKEWGDEHQITGQVRLPDWYRDQAQPFERPQDLVRWLNDGPPPIYLGFGSLPVLDPYAMIEMARQITRELKTRSILCAGWSELLRGHAHPSDDLFFVDQVDHEWLFPQCSLIVHHGGTGTTHTSAAAGVPSLICSTYADQPFWGERLKALGIGDFIPFAQLTKEKLLHAIRNLRDEGTRRRAREIGTALRSERGNEMALTFVLERIAKAPIYR